MTPDELKRLIEERNELKERCERLGSLNARFGRNQSLLIQEMNEKHRAALDQANAVAEQYFNELRIARAKVAELTKTLADATATKDVALRERDQLLARYDAQIQADRAAEAERQKRQRLAKILAEAEQLTRELQPTVGPESNISSD